MWSLPQSTNSQIALHFITIGIIPDPMIVAPLLFVAILDLVIFKKAQASLVCSKSDPYLECKGQFDWWIPECFQIASYWKDSYYTASYYLLLLHSSI